MAADDDLPIPEPLIRRLVKETDSIIEFGLGVVLFQQFGDLAILIESAGRTIEEVSTDAECAIGTRISEWSKGTSPIGWAVCPQVKIGRYRVDFLMFAGRWFEGKVYTIDFVVECDGRQFHDRTHQQMDRDRQRDRVITSYGPHVLRFSGSEINRNHYLCCEEIRMWAEFRLAYLAGTHPRG